MQAGIQSLSANKSKLEISHVADFYEGENYIDEGLSFFDKFNNIEDL
jgi:hypothetical protein